jgi:hypothetical protein
MTLPVGAYELRETLTNWRRVSTPDPLGGTSSTLQQVGSVQARVSQPTAAEQLEAQQAGSNLTMIVHMLPGTAVYRGDELRRANGDKLRVKYTISPSDPSAYLRADCEQIQAEGSQ